MHPLLFSIGSVKVHTYGFFVAVAFYVGIHIASREADRTGVDREKIMDFSLVILLSSIFGARLFSGPLRSDCRGPNRTLPIERRHQRELRSLKFFREAGRSPPSHPASRHRRIYRRDRRVHPQAADREHVGGHAGEDQPTLSGWTMSNRGNLRAI